jgi:hypothetical protein
MTSSSTTFTGLATVGYQSLFQRYGFKLLPPPYSTHRL